MVNARLMGAPAPRRPQLPVWLLNGLITSLVLISSSHLGCSDADRSVSTDASGDSSSATGNPQLITALSLSNPTSVARSAEPVRVGVPLPLTASITDASQLTLSDENGRALPLQATVLARWNGAPSDASRPIRWVLLSFPGTVAANSKVAYALSRDGTNPSPASTLTVADDGTTLTLGTGPASFTMSRASTDLFTSVVVDGSSLLEGGNGVTLQDNTGRTWRVDLRTAKIDVERQGRNEAVVRVVGSHVQSGGTSTLLDYTLRLTFVAGRSDVRLDYTLHNPDAAVHNDNVWPLGDAGSRYFEDVSLVLPLKAATTPAYLLSTGASTLSGTVAQELKIYQDSSGGDNYASENHMDANHWIPIQFRGYRVTSGSGTLASGDRVQPWLDMSTSSGGIAVSVRQFWQNFPKALACSSSGIRVGLFPTEAAGSFELQGGEQKSHEVTLYFHGGAGSAADIDPVMAAMSDPILVTPADAAWYQTTGAFFYEDSTRQGQAGAAGTLEATMDTLTHQVGAVPRSMVSQREVIDEYGWRNFGEVMSDYETECGIDDLDGPIAHANNQYDDVLGAFNMFARTLDRSFLEFAFAAARHTMDIDINHTKRDMDAYSGGMFWHTTHDTNADTATHRSYPLLSASEGCTQYTSGGPALGHLYVDGLMAYYFMTGDPIARDAVLELADFGIRRHEDYGDEAEGRAYGNYLQTLVQAYRLTGDATYYDAAVYVLAGGISAYMPAASPTEFKDAMLGKALGRFLDLKAERGETSDPDHDLAQMLLRDLADRALEASQPTDANLARWADVLAYAYKHCGDIAYWNRADALYTTLEKDYWARGTYPNSKELVVLLTNGHMVRWYRQHGL